MLDMSGRTIASGALPSLLSAAEAFVNAAVEDGGSHRVAIQLFDGRQFPVDVIDYTNDLVALQAAIDGLTNYVVVDSSTNLNGAVIAGLADVDAKYEASQAGAKSSALVVFTDGTDQTAYFTTTQAVAAVRASPSAVFTVGLGAELDANALRQIGKSGAEFAAQQSDIVAAFETIGAALEREAGGYYILSYCSPKRAGSHVLTVGVDGRPGQTSFTFNATGFGAGCTPEGVSDPCAGRDCGVVDGIVCGACTGDLSCNLSGQCIAAPVDVCGDGVKTVNEACDDGDTAGGDGCNASCTAVEGGFTCPTQGGDCTPICGDGLVRGDEACDDGDTAGGDGCNANCSAIEGGFTCPTQGGLCTATCGDGALTGGEACDDANRVNGDGCSESCVVEAGFNCAGAGASSCATQSCKALHQANPGLGDGTYSVDPDGAGPIAAFRTLCDMTRDGGGWTLVGKGREGWTWADAGQGSASGITDVSSFGVVALPASTVSALVGGVQQSSLTSGLRIIRASGVNNTATVKTLDTGGFSWNRFDGSARCGAGLPEKRGNGQWLVGNRNTTASMTDSQITPSGIDVGVNDCLRVWTFKWHGQGCKAGFTVGYQCSYDATCFRVNAVGNSGECAPMSTVWIRD